jgi:hypothetical protein
MNYQVNQSIDEILKNADPEQKLIWSHLFLTFGERISVGQYFYSGPLAGVAATLSTYNARIIYLAYCIEWELADFNSQPCSLQSFDQNNTQKRALTNGSYPYWDVTAAGVKFFCGTGIMKNQWFSRIVTTAAFIKFCGFRIGI